MNKKFAFIFLITISLSIFILILVIPIFIAHSHKNEYSRFVAIENGFKNGATFLIVYDKYTKVEYFVVEDGLYPLYNSDGSLVTYKEGN